MKLLNILKTKPDEITMKLMEGVSRGAEAQNFNLYEDDVDYEKLIELIFSSDRVVSWW